MRTRTYTRARSCKQTDAMDRSMYAAFCSAQRVLQGINDYSFPFM